MTPETIQRYQAGGDIYLSLQNQYGTAGANLIATAAQSGDATQVNDALTSVKYGANKDTSTLSILGNQLATDPLGAPLESLNNQLGAAVGNVFKNTWVLLAVIVAAAAAFFYFIGNPFKKK